MSALVTVARVSVGRLRDLSDQLDSCPPVRSEILLRNIQKESDSLSSILARLAKHCEALPPPEGMPKGTNIKPPDDPKARELVTMLAAASRNGWCACGKVRSEGGVHAASLAEEHVIASARQRADAADQ